MVSSQLRPGRGRRPPPDRVAWPTGRLVYCLNGMRRRVHILTRVPFRVAGVKRAPRATWSAASLIPTFWLIPSSSWTSSTRPCSSTRTDRTTTPWTPSFLASGGYSGFGVLTSFGGTAGPPLAPDAPVAPAADGRDPAPPAASAAACLPAGSAARAALSCGGVAAPDAAAAAPAGLAGGSAAARGSAGVAGLGWARDAASSAPPGDAGAGFVAPPTAPAGLAVAAFAV